MNVGQAVRLCRVTRGLSQEQLADKIRMSASYLSLIEMGKRDPALSTIQKIADALDVPLSIMVFLAASPGELSGLPQETQDKLAAAALGVMNAQRG